MQTPFSIFLKNQKKLKNTRIYMDMHSKYEAHVSIASLERNVYGCIKL